MNGAAARWSGLLVVGVVSQLGLTEPMWLQHLRISMADLEAHPEAAWWRGINAVHVLLVAVGAVYRRGDLAALLPPGWRERLRWRHLVLGAILFVACAVHLTRYCNRDTKHFAALGYGAQLGGTIVFFASDVLNCALIFASVPPGAARRIREWFGRRNWDRKLPWVLAAWAFAVSLLLGKVALDQVPHIPDEICYVFQAECLARGELWGKAPPNPDAFKVYLVTVENGHWFAVTSIGWPAILAIGSKIGAPWLVNPLLGGLAILLAHALTRRLFDVKAAHLVAFLMATSPWLLYLSASYMTHPASLVCMLGAWLCVTRAGRGSLPLAGTPARAAGSGAAPLDRGRAPWALLAGVLLGWLFLVRQLDAVLFAAITGIWMIGMVRAGRLRPAAIAACAVGCVAVASIVFPYNRAMTGDPFNFPLNAYMDKLWYPGVNRLGFGADIGNPTGGWGDLDPFPGHGLRDVLINTNQNLYATNFELFGWCIGSLFFVAVHLFFGKKTGVDRLMFWTVAVLLLGYNLYWFSGGPDFGARYWYLMIYPLVVLAARGIGTCVEGLRGGSAGETAADRMGVVVGVLALTTLAVFIPWRAITRYQDYRGFHGDYRRLERSLDPRALVFVKTKTSAVGMQGDADYSSAFIRNSPNQDEAHPIFAMDLGEQENRKTIAAFPDRPVVYVTGRSIGTGPTRITR